METLLRQAVLCYRAFITKSYTGHLPRFKEMFFTDDIPDQDIERSVPSCDCMSLMQFPAPGSYCKSSQLLTLGCSVVSILMYGPAKK